MKQFYYIATCDTCNRIIRTLDLPDSVERREIKTQPITVKELEMLYNRAGSYEALFSKRAKLYKERGLKNEALEEEDFRYLILEHYTFLKRPVLLYEDEIFIGNSSKTVASALNKINKER